MQNKNLLTPGRAVAAPPRQRTVRASGPPGANVIYTLVPTVNGIPRISCQISGFPNCIVKIPHMYCKNSGIPACNIETAIPGDIKYHYIILFH